MEPIIIAETTEIPVENPVVIKPDTKLSDDIVKTKKFNASKWGIIEKPLSESDKLRNKIICDLGEQNASTYKAKSNLITVGEYNYLKLREELSKVLILPSLPKKEEKKLKLNKKTQIILDNCQNTLKKKIETLVNILKNNPQDKLYEDLMSNFNFIEMRLIILMKIIENYTEIKSVSSIRNKIPLKLQKQTEQVNKSTPEKEEVLLAGKKILYLLKKVKNEKTIFSDYFNKIFSVEGIEIELCDQLISDLEYKINTLSSECGIKLYDIANRRPKLIFDTKYDMTIPQLSLRPYDTQIDLMNQVKNNITNGFAILYKTLPGLGKTTMILGICKYIKKSDLNIKVIFCCSDILESVRIQVLRTMYNFGVKFGVGTGTTSENGSTYKITNSWNCPKDEDRELIVADYVSTYNILKEKKHDYLLFFDEPTVHTDSETYSLTLEYLSKILYYMPKYTILSSATLPQINEMDNILLNYNTNYQNGVISEIVSNKTLTGCVIKDFNNNVISPHSKCNNVNDLKELIKKIKIFPLLGKFYTLPFLMNLNEFMKKFNKNIDLETIESFDQSNILENILILLERVCVLDESEFKDFTNIEIRDIMEDQFDKTRLDLKFEQVCPDKFLTSHAYKYIGCCLIATDNPSDYATQHLYPIVEKLKEKVGIRNINSNYEKYKRDLKKFEEEIDSINEKFNQDTKIDEEIEKIMHRKPEFKFPEILEINTHAHIETFAKYVQSYEKSVLKVPISFDSIDITDFNIDDELKFLLYMGVGLYCKNLDPDYCNLVLEMLSDRQLSYVIADESFCYGANYQISNVIINDDLGNSHSINTILQLIGRTSRVGKSWSGKVYLDVNTCNRIIQFFNDPKDNSNEGHNISKSFNSIVKVIDKENEIIKQKELEMEILRQKEEEVKRIAKEKDDDAKRIADEEKKARIESDKLSWREARTGTRTTRKIINKDVINENNVFDKVNEESKNDNYVLSRKLTEDNDWGNIRSKRENVTKKDSANVEDTVDKIYRPGAFRKSNTDATIMYNFNEISTKSEKPNSHEVPVQKKETNQNFRQQREDEIMGLLYKKNNVKITQSKQSVTNTKKVTTKK
jgi:hypothetical protein